MGYSKSVERLNPNAHSLSSQGRDASLPRRVAHAIHAACAFLLASGIAWMVRLTGRKIQKKDAPWLDCVVGNPGPSVRDREERVAEAEHLHLSAPPDAG